MMSVSSALGRELGDDLSSLVRAVDAPLAETTPVYGGTYPGYQPNAFRLRFADGRVLKGRRFDTQAQAETVEYVSRCLDYRGLPRVVARRGTALLMEWVDGQPLSAGNCTPYVLRRCGALQALIHCQTLPPESSYRPPRAIESWQASLERTLDELVECAVLDPSTARDARAIAREYAPRRCPLGFIYGDFCADNIVLRDSGEVCFVDNETLSVHPADYDVARTWYRWPMPRAAREVYLSGYREHRGLETFLAHFPYWAIAAIADGARFRQRRGGAAAAAVPVSRLRALMAHLECGGPAADAVFVS